MHSHPNPKRKPVSFVALIIALALVAAACSTGSEDVSVLGGDDQGEIDLNAADSEAVGEQVAFEFDDFDGDLVEFADFREGPVVINFFAAWCAACVAELPDFETVSNNFDGEVQFLGLSVQDRPEDSIALIEETGVTFKTGFDSNGAIFAQFGALGMPSTVFINANGEVVNVHGGVLTEASLTEAIESDLLSP